MGAQVDFLGLVEDDIHRFRIFKKMLQVGSDTMSLYTGAGSVGKFDLSGKALRQRELVSNPTKCLVSLRLRELTYHANILRLSS